MSTVVILSVGLTASLLVLITLALRGLFPSWTLDGQFCCIPNSIAKFNDWFVAATSKRLFGSKDTASTRHAEPFGDVGSAEDEWAGRVHRMEQSFQKMLRDTKIELTDEIYSLEKVSDLTVTTCNPAVAACYRYRARSLMSVAAFRKYRTLYSYSV